MESACIHSVWSHRLEGRSGAANGQPCTRVAAAGTTISQVYHLPIVSGFYFATHSREVAFYRN